MALAPCRMRTLSCRMPAPQRRVVPAGRTSTLVGAARCRGNGRDVCLQLRFVPARAIGAQVEYGLKQGPRAVPALNERLSGGTRYCVGRRVFCDFCDARSAGDIRISGHF